MNDIALVRLQREVSFSDNVKPICLPKGGISFKPGTNCTVTGFGNIIEGGKGSRTLKKTNLPIVDDNACSSLYGAQTLNQQFCAGYEEGKTASCQGDSGGSISMPKRWKVLLNGSSKWGCWVRPARISTGVRQRDVLYELDRDSTKI